MFILSVLILFVLFFLCGMVRLGNTKSMSKSYSKTFTKPTLTFYKHQRAEERSLRANQTQPRGACFLYSVYIYIILFRNISNHFFYVYFFESIFNFISRPNSTNKEGWPSLQGYGKMVNGLPTEHRKSPPLLDCLTDLDHMTPDEPDSELGTEQNTGLPPFPSALEPTRYHTTESKPLVSLRNNSIYCLEWCDTPFYLCFVER